MGGLNLVVLQKDRISVSFHGVATDQALLDAISRSVIQQYEGWGKGWNCAMKYFIDEVKI